MRTIVLKGDQLPKGKINLAQLKKELGTNSISVVSGGKVRKAITILEGGKRRVKQVEEEREPSITIQVPDEVNPTTITSAVVKHNPQFTDAEVAIERFKNRDVEKFKGNPLIKELTARVAHLEDQVAKMLAAKEPKK